MDTINPLIITFNCGRELVRPAIFSRYIVSHLPGQSSPEIIVISLQEISPIAYSFLGGSYLVPYFERFYHAVDLAAKSWDTQYSRLLTRNIGMTAIIVFVRADQVNRIQSIEEAATGVGVWEMGNKGAVAVRLGYSTRSEPVDLTFVAAHLAPMERDIQRRNEDWKNIVRRLVFTPVNSNGTPVKAQGELDERRPLLSPLNRRSSMSGIYTPTSYVFIAGDLNYRTSDTKPESGCYEAYPQPNNHDQVPSLLQHDQLKRELEARRTLHDFLEAPINFPPTYKYSDRHRKLVRTQEEVEEKGGRPDEDIMKAWGWAMHRWPSWCDRILYLDVPSWMKADESKPEIRIHEYTALPLMSSSDHRAVMLSLSLPMVPISLPELHSAHGVRFNPPYSLDPIWKQKRATARREEIVVGILSYFSLTREGNMILAASIIGALGGWALIQNLLG